VKENKETTKSKAQEIEGSSRRNFIAKTLFAGASLAAGFAESGQRPNRKAKK
jgi:hypothetical protein